MLEAYVDPAAPVLAGYRALTVKKAVLHPLTQECMDILFSMMQIPEIS